MSFFGLTAFGPESIIKSSLVNSGCFTLYFDDDYKRGFSEVIKKHGRQGAAISPNLFRRQVVDVS